MLCPKCTKMRLIPSLTPLELNPAVRERYEGAGDETTRQELRALFDVIGTPAWSEVEGVQSRAWRNYLQVRTRVGSCQQIFTVAPSIVLVCLNMHYSFKTPSPPQTFPNPTFSVPLPSYSAAAALHLAGPCSFPLFVTSSWLFPCFYRTQVRKQSQRHLQRQRYK